MADSDVEITGDSYDLPYMPNQLFHHFVSLLGSRNKAGFFSFTTVDYAVILIRILLGQ